VGEPDTEECGDYTTAWASASGDSVEWLEVYYDTPVYVTEVNIVQTYNPDQVVEVELVSVDGEYESVYTQEPETVENPCPYVLGLESDPTDYLVQGLRITIDQSILGRGWNEIDAVEMIGIPGDDTVAQPSPEPEPTEAAGGTEPLEEVIWRAGGESGYEEGQFNSITGMDFGPDGNLYVADNLSRILVVSPEGETIGAIEGNGLWNVSDVKVADDGTIYAADWGSDDAAIYVFSPDGELLNSWGPKGTGNGQFGNFSPEGLAVCPDGKVYVADENEDANEEGYERIQVFDAQGNYLTQWNIYDVAPNYGLSGIDCGPDGNIYMVGFIGNRVVVYDPSGNHLGDLGEDALFFTSPDGIAVDDQGNIYVGTWSEGVILLDPDGNLVDKWGANTNDDGPRVEGQLHYPEGIAIDAEGNVYVGDWGGAHSYISKFKLP
jgi:sugar lactone lactonase YvrE